MSMVPLVSSAEELPEAFRYATLHPSSRWYVASRARAFDQAESIPADWQIAEPVVAASEPTPAEAIVADEADIAVAADAADAEYRRTLGLTADASDEVVALVAAHFDKVAEEVEATPEELPTEIVDTPVVADAAETDVPQDAEDAALHATQEAITDAALTATEAVETVVAAASISDKPWSDFSASDYTPEQYKHACLVAQGDTKDECHLPVREPDGTLNRNGVHAAAAALAGARGGVNLSPQQRKVAARKLKSLYGTLGEDLPDSIKTLTAAIAPPASGFDDTKHPRGSDGTFIEVDGRVVVAGRGEGNVSEIFQDSSGVTHIVVVLDGGQKISITPDQVSAAPDAKAHIAPNTSHTDASRSKAQGGSQSVSGRVDAFRQRAQARRQLHARVAAATATRSVPTGHPDVDHSIDVHPIHGVARSLMNKSIKTDPATEHARVDSILKEADPAIARQQLDRLMAEAKLSGHQRSRYRSLLSQHHESALRGLDDVEVSAQARKFPAGTPEGDAARAEATRRVTERVAPVAPFDRPGHGRPQAPPAEAPAAVAAAAI